MYLCDKNYFMQVRCKAGNIFNYSLPNHLLTDRQWTQVSTESKMVTLIFTFYATTFKHLSLHYVHPCVRDNTQNLLGLVGCLYMPPRARICPKSLFGILGVQIIQILPWSKLELENLTTLYCLCRFGQPKICKVCLLRPKGQLVCLIFQTQT